MSSLQNFPKSDEPSTDMNGLLSFICRIVLGGIFLTAGLAKISDPVRFIFTLRDFRLFPEVIVPFLAVYLPWLEFVLGLFILTGLLYRSGSLLLAFLNAAFTLAILSVIIRGIEIDCGCFGLLADALNLPDMADMRAVVRNLLFTGICLYVYRAGETVFSIENYIRKR